METEPRYAWHDFEQDESTDQIADKEILTITDDGEEMAVIVHRNVPTLHNERMKDAKRERAQRIVDALNAYEKTCMAAAGLRATLEQFEGAGETDPTDFAREFAHGVSDLLAEMERSN